MVTVGAPPDEYPLVRPEQIVRGAYLADVVAGRLYCVWDVRVATREDGSRVRLAMLEDAVSSYIKPWEFGQLTEFRAVHHHRDF